MALSELGFYGPKRFTISPGLTNTKVGILGTKNVQKMSKNQKSFLNLPHRFGSFSGGSDDMNIA